MNELVQKNMYLSELSSNLSQQNQSLSEERDLLKTLLNEVREQNYAFSKQISELKIEMNKIMLGGGGGYALMQDELQVKESILKRDETIEALKHEVESIAALEAENRRLRLEMEQQRSENTSLMAEIKVAQK